MPSVVLISLLDVPGNKCFRKFGNLRYILVICSIFVIWGIFYHMLVTYTSYSLDMVKTSNWEFSVKITILKVENQGTTLGKPRPGFQCETEIELCFIIIFKNWIEKLEPEKPMKIPCDATRRSLLPTIYNNLESKNIQYKIMT